MHMKGFALRHGFMKGLLAAAALTLLSSVPAHAQSYYNAPDGTVLSDYETNTYFLIMRGARFSLSPSELSYFFPPWWNPLGFVTHSTMESITRYPPDGTLVRERSSTATYVIIGGRKWVPATSADIEYYGGSSAVRVVPNDSLGYAGFNYASNGIMVRDRSTDQVYVLFRNTWFALSSESDVHYYGGWQNVRILPDGAIASMSSRAPCGARFRERSSGSIYIMNDFGGKALITSPDGNDWANHYVVPDGSLARFPDRPYVCMN